MVRSMNLQDYIQKHGVSECARRWKVTRQTVQNWKKRATMPSRNKHLPRILSTTRLTMQDIFA